MAKLRLVKSSEIFNQSKFNNAKRLVKCIQYTHREIAPSNKIPALTDIWVVGTSNQLFIRGSQTDTKFSRK